LQRHRALEKPLKGHDSNTANSSSAAHTTYGQ
jgi:hypothetical protein